MDIRQGRRPSSFDFRQYLIFLCTIGFYPKARDTQTTDLQIVTDTPFTPIAERYIGNLLIIKELRNQSIWNIWGDEFLWKVVTWIFGVFDFLEKFQVDISGDKKATVKREDGHQAEPPAALDL